MSSVYRTHTCGQLRPEHVGQQARLSGWVQRKRDHGNLLFIDLRDHYGVTQVVVDVASPVFKTAETVRSESVITVSGKVVAREQDTVNPRLATGAVELDASEMTVQSMAEPLPIPVYIENDGPEAWIGLSTHGFEQLAAADAEPEVDVVAFGPIFATSGKERPDPPVGMARLRRARAATAKPLVAIGGIDAGNIAQVLQAGADGAAVLGAVCRGDVRRNCRLLLAAAAAGPACASS